jgi:hypothetical protein
MQLIPETLYSHKPSDSLHVLRYTPILSVVLALKLLIPAYQDQNPRKHVNFEKPNISISS